MLTVKTALIAMLMLLGFHANAYSACNIEPGVYVSNRENKIPENTGLLLNPENYTEDELLETGGSLVLTVDNSHRMLMKGFVGPPLLPLGLYRTFLVGQIYSFLVGPPKVEQVKFNQLNARCSADSWVLSWKKGSDKTEYFEGIMLEGGGDKNKRKLFVKPLLVPAAFITEFVGGDDERYLVFNKLDSLPEINLEEPQKCMIPAGIYKGEYIFQSLTVELKVEGSISIQSQNTGVFYNDPPVTVNPVVYDCQGLRLSIVYMNENDKRYVYVGEWNHHRKVIENAGYIQILSNGLRFESDLTPP